MLVRPPAMLVLDVFQPTLQASGLVTHIFKGISDRDVNSGHKLSMTWLRSVARPNTHYNARFLESFFL